MSSSIQRLTILDSVTGSTQVPVSLNSQDMRVAMTAILTYMQANLSFPAAKTAQYSAPSATGFSVQVTNTSANTWLILTPAAGYAAGTIVMPASTAATHGQEVLINCTQNIAALTVDGNGATVTGEPAAITANDFFLLKFDSVTITWYRVG